MPSFKVLTAQALAVLAVSSLVAGSVAYAGPATARSAAPKEPRPSVVAKEVQPDSRASEEAPIVMGRSVAVVRKSKLHHIKAKPTHPAVTAKN